MDFLDQFMKTMYRIIRLSQSIDVRRKMTAATTYLNNFTERSVVIYYIFIFIITNVVQRTWYK